MPNLRNKSHGRSNWLSLFEAVFHFDCSLGWLGETTRPILYLSSFLTVAFDALRESCNLLQRELTQFYRLVPGTVTKYRNSPVAWRTAIDLENDAETVAAAALRVRTRPSLVHDAVPYQYIKCWQYPQWSITTTAAPACVQWQKRCFSLSLSLSLSLSSGV